MTRLAVALATLCTVFLLAVPAARAGEYRVRACATDAAATGGEDLAPRYDAGLMSAANACASLRQVQLNARSGTAWSSGEQGAWLVHAPPGTRLIRVHVRVEGRTRDGIVPYADVFDGERSLQPRAAGGAAPLDYDWWGSATAAGVFLRCGLFSRRPCLASPVTAYALGRDFDLTLSDDAAPVDPTAGGELAAGGWRHGEQALEFAAADAGGGVDRVELRVDGQLARAAPAPCARANGVYARVAPCPAEWRGALGLDTRALADGAHALELAAIDAGGAAAVRPFSVSVDNTPPPGPAGAAVEPAGWTRENSFTLRWRRRAAGDRGSPIAAALVEVGAGPVQRVAGDDLEGVAGLVAVADGATPVRVWLADAAGNADPATAAGATLLLDTAPPNVAFADQDPADPARVRAPVDDAASGVAGGAIALRPVAGGDWRRLPTERRGGALEAVVPDAALAAGLYALEARAEDRAGNAAAAVVRRDGRRAMVELPLRRPVRLVAGFPAPRRVVDFGRGAGLAGRLTERDGRPIAGAAMTVESTVDRPGATSVGLPAAVTGPDGSFRIALPAGASRRYRVAFAGSPTQLPAAAEARLRVRAGVTLRAAPRRLRNGRRVRFRGRVAAAGTPLPRGGKLVVVQFLDRRRGGSSRWRPVALVRSDARGRFRAAHRFRSIAVRTRFAFRAVAPAEESFAFARGASRPVAVTVVPRPRRPRRGPLRG